MEATLPVPALPGGWPLSRPSGAPSSLASGVASLGPRRSAAPATGSGSSSPASRCSWCAARTGRCAPSTTCAATGARSSHRPTGPSRGHVRRLLRCPYHAWAYGLDGRLRRAPWPGGRRTRRDSRLHEVGLDEMGRLRVRRLDAATADARRALAEQLGPVPERCGATRWPSCARAVASTYEVGRNWKVLAENYNECYHCGPVHPELCDLVPAFRSGGGDRSTGSTASPTARARGPSPRTGTTARRPFPALDEHERVRHKGELVYPNLLLSLAADHVAAFAPDPAGPAHTTVVCDFLFAPGRDRRPGFDPSDAVDALGRRQPPGLGDLRERAARHGLAWVHRGWFAPMEDAEPRHRPLVPPRMAMPRERWRDRERRRGPRAWPERRPNGGRPTATSSSSGSGRSGAPPLCAARRGARDRPRAVRARRHERRRVARPLRASSGARTTPPATSSSPRRPTTPGDGRARAASRSSSAPGASTCSRPAPRSPSTTTRRRWTRPASPFESSTAREVTARWPRSRSPTTSSPSTRPTPGCVAADRATAAAARARAHGAELRARRRSCESGRRRDRGWSVDGADRPCAGPTGRRARADAWTNRLLAGSSADVPLTVLQEQLTYYRGATIGAFVTRAVPGVDLDGRAVLVRLPAFGEPGGEDRPRTAAAGGRLPTTRAFDPDPAMLERT